MRDTLVLNASFEPLSTVTLNRAVVLILQDKAVVEQSHPDLRMRGAAVDIPVPRVIRLCRYVRVPFRRHAPWSRRGVLIRDQHRCAYCGRRASTVDHVVPRAQGVRTPGSTRWRPVPRTITARRRGRRSRRGCRCCGSRSYRPRRRRCCWPWGPVSGRSCRSGWTAPRRRRHTSVVVVNARLRGGGLPSVSGAAAGRWRPCRPRR